MEKAISREDWVQVGMYRCSSWGHCCQTWWQLVESHKKQVRVEERNWDIVCGWFFGWWSPPSSTERSEPAGNRLLHECPREPSCPTFKIFAAPVVPTPAFWVRWKMAKREKGEHWWKSKCSPLPIPELVLQWARKPVSLHMHSHPSTGNSHVRSTMKFMQFFPSFTGGLKYVVGWRQHLWCVEWRCFVWRGPACRELSSATVLINDTFGKHSLQRKHLSHS